VVSGAGGGGGGGSGFFAAAHNVDAKTIPATTMHNFFIFHLIVTFARSNNHRIRASENRGRCYPVKRGQKARKNMRHMIPIVRYIIIC
jgi:hypothetical protein